MKLTEFTAKPYYGSLIHNIKQICLMNLVDDTHGLAHSVKIGREVEKALRSEPSFNVDDAFYENIILAGYLHDIDDRKYFKTSGYENATKVLKNIQICDDNIKKIVTMIDLVSFAKNGNSISEEHPILYYLPRYIDRIDAIGVQGLYRSYQYNQKKMKQFPMYLQSTPKPLSKEEAISCSRGRQIEYMKFGYSKSVVDHFFDKLIHIKLPKQITNPYLINLYQVKLDEMIEFVIENARENYNNYENNLVQWNSKQRETKN